jgi:hypothetical protein
MHSSWALVVLTLSCPFNSTVEENMPMEGFEKTEYEGFGFSLSGR